MASKVLKIRSADKISLGILAAGAVISLVITVLSLLNIRTQELLIEFRFNFLQGFVEKSEWYVLYLPALVSLTILGVNFLIMNRSEGKVDELTLRLYLAGSLLVQILTLVVVISLHTAIGL